VVTVFEIGDVAVAIALVDVVEAAKPLSILHLFIILNPI
jgi:hypothetical protein